MKNSRPILWLAGWLTTGVCVGVSRGAAATTRSAPADYADDESRAEITPDSPSMAWWRESMKTRDERLAWWREARFGMFIHWGVYSGLGGVWKDPKLTTGYSEHIQRRLKIPIAEYRANAAGNLFAVKLGDQTLTGVVRPGKAITQPLGTVKLAPGSFDIRIVPQELQRGELMKLRGLTLTPAAR